MGGWVGGWVGGETPDLRELRLCRGRELRLCHLAVSPVPGVSTISSASSPEDVQDRTTMKHRPAAFPALKQAGQSGVQRSHSLKPELTSPPASTKSLAWGGRDRCLPRLSCTPYASLLHSLLTVV